MCFVIDEVFEKVVERLVREERVWIEDFNKSFTGRKPEGTVVFC